MAETVFKEWPTKGPGLITLFLCGDVMTGRGIDQILPHPSDPAIHEGYMKDARGYVEIAEKVSGPIPRSVAPEYIWGDAPDEMESIAPDLRIINLETSVTKSDDYWEGKQIHYRMHPQNIDCITTTKIDACSLANNHVLDWGYAGLKETLETLRKVKSKGCGCWDGPQGGRIPCNSGDLRKRESGRVRFRLSDKRCPLELGGFQKETWHQSAKGFLG